MNQPAVVTAATFSSSSSSTSRRIDPQSKRAIVSQPPARKSRSISRYFLGHKRASIDGTTQENAIHRCLASSGVFDSYELWTHVTLLRDDTSCRRLFVLTEKKELIIIKSSHRSSLLKMKERIDLTRLWFCSHVQDSIASEITSLTYYDAQRSIILGWPLAENFVVEFETKSICDLWKERFESTLRFCWQLHSSTVEHVRIVIDQNSQSSNQRSSTTSFLIRKVIGIRPEETVRDLIKKCIDAFHLRDPSVDNYVLFVSNHSTSLNAQISHGTAASPSIQITNRPLIGHEYPYSIKMKHVKAINGTPMNNRSFDADDHSISQSQYNHSSASLNSMTTTTYHDFELRKRETPNDHSTKKHRFFHKRRTKLPQHLSDDYHSSSTPYLSSPNRTKSSYSNFFGHNLDELLHRHDQQLPPVIMQLLNVLYVKGPDTTGIFRKVANTRAVKDSIEKIERNLSLHEDDLHPILAAGIFKHFLRTLPEPIFDSVQYDHWKKCLRLVSLSEKITYARKNILITLSEANHILLKGLICILNRISQNSDSNGMNPFNLGLCVSNSLFKTESTTISSGKQEADVMSSIVEFLIQNGSALFGSDVITCVAEKRILVQSPSHPTRPTASSIESLDEVESSPQLPVVNRSHDSGLAASDQPFNDDSSEISEHFRRRAEPTPSPPELDWTSSIACGHGAVLTSIILPSTNHPQSTTTTTVARRRSSKAAYKPSRQFLEREKLTNDTTDESDHQSSLRSSTTTVQNSITGKIKRSKSLSRHSSLGSGEQQQHQHKSLFKETRRSTINEVKRTTSLKLIHHSSDEGDEDDEQQKQQQQQQRPTADEPLRKKCSNPTKPTPSHASPTIHQERTKERSSPLRSTDRDQQDLDLINEPLTRIDQRLINSTVHPVRKVEPPSISSQRLKSSPTPVIVDHQPRANKPLSSTTNQVYLVSPTAVRYAHQQLRHESVTKSSERLRTFVHRSNSRPFVLGTAIQMKPITNSSSSNDRHRLSDHVYPYQGSSRTTPPVSSGHSTMDRRLSSSQSSTKSLSLDSSDERRVWSVREKAKLFEHGGSSQKLSTGRENYV